MSFWKKKRVEDRKLLNAIKKWPCLVCKSTYCVDPAHIHSKGAGGPDLIWNVIPLCRICHTIQHADGWKTFWKQHPIAALYLQTLGWYWLREDKL